jgi:hypothetical protein
MFGMLVMGSMPPSCASEEEREHSVLNPPSVHWAFPEWWPPVTTLSRIAVRARMMLVVLPTRCGALVR